MANLKMSDNPVPSLLIAEATEPTAPAAGHQRLYIDSTSHLLKATNSSGVERTIEAAGGGMATDVLWNAAGDLAVGTGSDTGTRLGIGNAGAVLARINGAVAWNASTSFPTATTGDRFFRTDLGREFYYDGTRWVSMHTVDIAFPSDSQTQQSVTANSATWQPCDYKGGSDLWIVSATSAFFVNTGGTALGASHKWVNTIDCMVDGGTTLTTIATMSLDSGANGNRKVTHTIGATLSSLQAGTIDGFRLNIGKTGTPGTCFTGAMLTVRIIAT